MERVRNGEDDPAADPASPCGVGKPLVLLVENDLAQRNLTAFAIRQAGLRVDLQTASDGESALATLNALVDTCARRQSPVLVLLEPRVFGPSGVLALRRLPPKWRRSGVRVVVLSNSRGPQDIVDAFAAGSLGYYVKPAQFSGLVQLIDQIGRRWLQQ